MKTKLKLLTILLPLLVGMTLLAGHAATLQPEVFLADADFTVIGEDNGDWTAYFASPAGDVNGDGLGDFLVGAPMAGNKVCPYPDPNDCRGLPKGEGRAYLVLGKPEGEWPASPMNLVNADAAFLGCEVNSMTARQLYTAGDVNGDGYDDILISGWKCGDNYRGKTYLILGKPEADWGRDFPLDTQADASFLGEVERDFSSYYTSTAGDVNGDGFDDILISSTHNDENGEDAGQIYLILGNAAADWGRDFSLSNADATFLGEDIGDRLGRATAPAGDVNGDGIEDFLIGSISSDDGAIDAGETYLILGRAAADWGKDVPIDVAADASFLGEGEGDESGRRMAAAGDVNGDGFDDFIIGGSKNDEFGIDSGKTYLILGNASADWGDDFPLAQADAIFIGEERRDQSGRRVSGAGDPNNDGYADFLIGAPHNSRNGEASGTAYLVYGRPEADWGQEFSLANADVAYLGKPDVGVAGYDVAWVGDFNGDLIDDFLIAAYGGRNNDTVPGEAYLILGNDLPQVEVLSPADGFETGLGSPVLFEGTATDGLDGDLTSQLVWLSSIDGNIGAGGSFETTLSEGTHTITAQVTDSGGFTVKNQITVSVLTSLTPEITISSPSPGAAFDVGKPIPFSGTALDFEDGDISASLIWSSSLDGEIGTGASFENSGLSVGNHVITATATDSDGKTGSAIVKVRVKANAAPVAISFAYDTPEGEALTYHRYIAMFGDKNGAADIDLVEMVIEPTPDDPFTLKVSYHRLTNELYLFDFDANNWIGPCTPGERTTLATSTTELDCGLSTGVIQGDSFLKFRVRARWIQNIDAPIEMAVKLRATDLAGNDTGYLPFGTWTLLPLIR